MPTHDARINGLVDYLYGRESQSDDVGAVSRFVRLHVTMRPALTDQSRWPDIDALKTHARYASNPTITPAQIDAAVTAAGV
jgi:hypothetical protein